MSKLIGLAALSGAVALVPFFQAPAEIKPADLKPMLDGMGYESKVLNAEAGKEKYEFKLTKGGLDVPMAIEISPSGRYIWLTVFLGKGPDAASPKNSQLLHQNAKQQPTQFYITDKENLMIALPVENRAMTAIILRRNVDKLVDDVVSSQAMWSKT
jgi:hypothetical protein